MKELILSAKVSAEFVKRVGVNYDKWFVNYDESYTSVKESEEDLYKCIVGLVYPIGETKEDVVKSLNNQKYIPMKREDVLTEIDTI